MSGTLILIATFLMSAGIAWACSRASGRDDEVEAEICCAIEGDLTAYASSLSPREAAE